MNFIISRALPVTRRLDLLQPLLLLAGRLYVAFVFFRSGTIKLQDWGATLALFRDEYQVPALPPDLAAYVGTFGEIAFPILIAFGLFGRLGAVGLFFVNVLAVVSYPQLFGFECPAGINAHFYWGSLLLALVAFGPGPWSVDGWVLRRLGTKGGKGPVAVSMSR